MELRFMRIAFDIDDTLGGTYAPSLEFFNQQYGANFTLETVPQQLKALGYHYTTDPFSVLYGIEHAKVSEVFSLHSDVILDKCIPFQKALELANQYAADGHEIFYITARNAKWETLTSTWLKTQGFPTGTLIFERDDKAGVAEKLGIDVFYEDNVVNAIAISAKGIKTYLINSIANYHDDIPVEIERLSWAG
jgi:uncharacterized HAD superfamily protein